MRALACIVAPEVHHMAKKLTRAQKSKANKLAWQKRPPPARKKPLTRTQLQVLRQEAWRLGRRLGAEGPWSLPDVNADFRLPSKPPPLRRPHLPPEEG